MLLAREKLANHWKKITVLTISNAATTMSAVTTIAHSAAQAKTAQLPQSRADSNS